MGIGAGGISPSPKWRPPTYRISSYGGCAQKSQTAHPSHLLPPPLLFGAAPDTLHKNALYIRPSRRPRIAAKSRGGLTPRRPSGIIRPV